MHDEPSADTSIRHLGTLLRVRRAYESATRETPGPVLTVGGDCGVEYAAVARAAEHRNVALVWFDAHADANTPATSPSGAFHGMVLRSLVDDGLVDDAHVVLVGCRALDPGEARWVERHGITVVSVEDLARDPRLLAGVLDRLDVDGVYVHVDLDVLDPAELAGLGYPEPGGLTTEVLLAAVEGATSALPVLGAGLTEFAPSSLAAAAEDLPVVARVVDALTPR